MDYLLKTRDQHKFDSVNSKLIWGIHPENPKYSIVIPTYRRPELLRESLQSAIGQQRVSEYEIIVVDNNADESVSNSKTLEVIKEFDSPKVVYYKNEENIGIYGNTLRAAQLAKGEYVALLNDDDLLHPHYLDVMNAFLEKYHYKGIIGSMPWEFYESGYTFSDIPEKVPCFEVSKIEFFFGCCVTSPGMMYPKKILYDIYNSYEELLMGDQIIQYRALRKYGLAFVSFPLAAYRVQENATLNEDVLCDMIYHMCNLRKQTAKENIWLRLFVSLFYKEYCNWYIDSTLYFWEKRRLRKRVAQSLDIHGTSRWSLKQIFVRNLIDEIHTMYSRKHIRTSDYIEFSYN